MVFLTVPKRLRCTQLIIVLVFSHICINTQKPNKASPTKTILLYIVSTLATTTLMKGKCGATFMIVLAKLTSCVLYQFRRDPDAEQGIV